ncbi:uncharacterized protein LOC141720293 [Apium graveolens]|uniref:uncharacterized protein LOC141720293 n=1 Tax=Apium graveolens TaxID=4045 RepID=UPI003D79F275
MMQSLPCPSQAGDEFGHIQLVVRRSFGDEDDDEEDFMHTGEKQAIAQEVLSIYKSLTPEKLTMKDSSKVCDVLVLFEVGDPSTKVAVHCLLESGLFPLCLKSIEYGNELSQSTASWIMSRITMQEQGLQYCCEPANRLCAIMKVFNDVIEKMQDEPSTTVLKNIIQCYVILSDDPRLASNLCTPYNLKKITRFVSKAIDGCGPNAEAVGDVAGSSHLDR